MSLLPDESRGAEGDDGQKFLAGWMDGNAAGRHDVVETFRREGARHGLSCDPKCTVFEAGDALPAAVPAVSRDNPEADPRYDAGWSRGYREIVARLVKRLRVQLVEHDLFVSDSGRLVVVDVVSKAADDHGKARFDAPLPLGDDALHAFIDGEAETEAAEPVDAGEDSSSKSPSSAGLLGRRVLLGTAIGALVSGAGTFAVAHRFVSARRDVGTAQNNGPSYTPPTWWDSEPVVVRDFYLAWDHMVWSLEQDPAEVEALRSALRTVMQTPGYDSLKRKIIGFMTDSQRAGYAGDLLHALIPGAAGNDVPGVLFGALRTLVAQLGAGGLDSASVAALLAYRNMSLSPDASTAEALDLLLSDLGH